MTDDIVTRLKNAYRDADEVACVYLAEEAANEIKKLRSELSYCRDIELSECRFEYQKLRAKYQRALRGDV